MRRAPGVAQTPHAPPKHAPQAGCPDPHHGWAGPHGERDLPALTPLESARGSEGLPGGVAQAWYAEVPEGQALFERPARWDAFFGPLRERHPAEGDHDYRQGDYQKPGPGLHARILPPGGAA